MTTLTYIFLANLISTLASISLAAALSFRLLAGLVDKLVCVSAGLLLTVATTHLLPEAFHGEAVNPFTLGWTLLGGILGLFLLEKLTLIHHTHHHEGDTHHHH